MQQGRRVRCILSSGLLLLAGTMLGQAPRAAGNGAAPGTYLVLPTVADSTLTTQPKFNRPNLVLMPQGAIKPQLVVFLPGTDGAPVGYKTLLEVVRAGGFRTIALDYDNEGAPGAGCQSGTDPRCAGMLREERLRGDAPKAPVQNTVAEGIVQRLEKLLAYLQQQHPNDGWGDYLIGGHPAWGRMIISGHSFGAGFAAFIGKQFEVSRVVCFSGPADAYLKDGRPTLAEWITAPAKTPANRSFAEYNKNENKPAALEEGYAGLRIPANQVLEFSLPLPDGASGPPARFHLDGVVDARYTPQWQKMFGIAGGSQVQ